MIASTRGKKPHVYRVIILNQMADHIFLEWKRGLKYCLEVEDKEVKSHCVFQLLPQSIDKNQ